MARFIAKVSDGNRASQRVADQHVDTCAGWAYSGGGAWVERVEISIDGGFIWHEVRRFS